MINLNKIYKEVSEETGLSEKKIETIYKIYWISLRDIITTIPFEANMPEKEFMKHRVNISIPYIGKLVTTYKRYRGIKGGIDRAHNLRKQNKEE